MLLAGLGIEDVDGIGGNRHPDYRFGIVSLAIDCDWHPQLVKKFCPVVQVVADALYEFPRGAIAFLVRAGCRSLDLKTLQITLAALIGIISAVAIPPDRTGRLNFV